MDENKNKPSNFYVDNLLKIKIVAGLIICSIIFFFFIQSGMSIWSTIAVTLFLFFLCVLF
ncbi:MAG: hypothetical protein A3G34_10620 [Candidatus Lindowbacteria bacterium RIFCSPLOWO2_12_FULL_62_27]|nr:MAG: hypothetical protein A3G34_10620 [Candidatus Lindowbacteria bacterium RIFCSPLOWO2_12_FULL_62_27]